MFGYSLSATPNTLIVGTLSLKGPEIPVTVVQRCILDKILPPAGVIGFGFCAVINPKYIIIAGNKAKHAVLFVYTTKKPYTLVAEINVGDTLGLTDVAIGEDNTIAAIVHAYPRVYLYVYEYQGQHEWDETDTKMLECGLFDPKVQIFCFAFVLFAFFSTCFVFFIFLYFLIFSISFDIFSLSSGTNMGE